MLNISTHYELLEGSSVLMKLTDRGHEHCRAHDVPQTHLEAEMSVWLTTCVMEIGLLVADENWSYAYHIACASNRAWRDYVRSERSRPDWKDEVPVEGTGMYYRMTHPDNVETAHIVAHNLNTHEVIDPMFWRWRDPELNVNTSSVSWVAIHNGRSAIPQIENADWMKFVVAPVDEATMTERFLCSRKGARSIIRNMLNKEGLGKALLG